MNFKLRTKFGAAHGRCTSPRFHREDIYWGEYFDNRERAEVHIYASADRGERGKLPTHFPREAYGTSTTLFTIAGAIAFGF